MIMEVIDVEGKKEVKKVKDNVFYFTVVEFIKKHGKLPPMDVSKQLRNYYIRKLKLDGIIHKVGYGTWEINPTKFDKLSEISTPLTSKNIPPTTGTPLKYFSAHKIRGHGYIFTRNTALVKGYEKHESILKSKSIPFTSIPSNKSLLIVINKDKVLLSPRKITIYQPSDKSFVSDSCKESQSLAINDLIKTFKQIESMLDIKLNVKGTYEFEVARSHYARLNDELARQVNDKGDKLRIYKDGELRFLVDFSLKAHEMETVHATLSKSDMDTYVDHIKGLIDHRDEFGLNFKANEVTRRIDKNTLTLDKISSIIEGQTKNFSEIQDILLKSSQMMNAHTSEISAILATMKGMETQINILANFMTLDHKKKELEDMNDKNYKEDKPDYVG